MSNFRHQFVYPYKASQLLDAAKSRAVKVATKVDAKLDQRDYLQKHLEEFRTQLKDAGVAGYQVAFPADWDSLGKSEGISRHSTLPFTKLERRDLEDLMELGRTIVLLEQQCKIDPHRMFRVGLGDAVFFGVLDA